MTNQNNAAQPVLTDDEILAATLYGQSEARMIRNGRAIESAVLSKLRAPVAGDGKTRVPGDQLGGPAAAWDDGAQSNPNRPESRASFESKGGALAPVAGEAQKPVAWFIDWPDEPELGHYIAESPADSGRNRPLVFADASTQESTPVPEEPVYAYRRKGMDDFVTCNRERFDELSAKPRLFETRIFYAAPQARPSDDELWDQTLAERDEYHDMADKLADAIADHLLVEIGEHSSSNCPWMRALDAIQNAAPQASEAVREVAGVTLDGCLETLFRVGEHLGINYAESRKLTGAPSGVYIKAIEDRVSQARDTALEEAAKLMDQTSRSTGATLIRAALSAQPAAEPLSNPKQFALTGSENIRAGAPYDDPAFEALCREHGIWGTAQSALCAVFWRQAGQQRAAGDERTAFEATYQADYDDPGASCEREHFGKGYRAGMAAQSTKEQNDAN